MRPHHVFIVRQQCGLANAGVVPCARWHEDGRLYGVSPDGAELVERDADTFMAGVEARSPSPELACHDQIVSIDTCLSRCAVAKVQVALPSPAGEAVLYTDFLVLLKLDGAWRVISKIYTSVPLSQRWFTEPQPFNYSNMASDPIAGVLEYYKGGHLSQPEIMAENFHERARLCFSDADERLVKWSQAEFFERVKSRPVTAGVESAIQFDKILGVDKAGPDCACIKLMIGYQPHLYTDVLSMLRIGGKWWIVAKSSDHELY